MTWTRESICRARGLDPATFAPKLIGSTTAEWDSSAVAFKAIETGRLARQTDVALRAASAGGAPGSSEPSVGSSKAFDQAIRTRAGRPPADQNTTGGT